jgi:hypothetical protein
LTLSLTNPAVDSVTAQVLLPLPNGLLFRSASGPGNYDAKSGFWQVTLAANATTTLVANVVVQDSGDFDLTARISGAAAEDSNSINNSAQLTLTPANLDPAPPVATRSADIEGIILSSLTQISGTISESTSGVNAYAISLELGAGGLGGGSSDSLPFTGFLILNEELVPIQAADPVVDPATDPATDPAADPAATDPAPVTEELRQSMLILTSNGTSVYLNKLFFVSQEEIAGGT